MTHSVSGRLRPVFFAALSFALLTPIGFVQNAHAELSSSERQALLAQAPKLERIELDLNGHAIEVEVADKEHTRSIGLMYRTEMPNNQGMLFVFDYPHRPCFWMKNTYIPLSIAFITEQGEIASIHHMDPHSTNTHCPTQPVLYALEMNQGWFENQKITVGDKIKGLP